MDDGRRVTVAALLFEGGLLLLAVALGALLGRPPLAAARADWVSLARGIAATAPPLLLLAVAARARRGPLRRLTDRVAGLVAPLFAGCSWLDLALIAAVAGLAEETLFRGVIQEGLVAATGPATGLAATSALFGLVHWITPAYAGLAALMGVYLGGLVLTFHDLTVAIVVHALYDFVALAYLVRSPRATASL